MDPDAWSLTSAWKVDVGDEYLIDGIWRPITAKSWAGDGFRFYAGAVELLLDQDADVMIRRRADA